MADSDSELDDYTETNVLLGYPEKESKGDDISHLGGAPTWLHPDSPADARLAKCGSCNKLMTLLLQLNGAVPESPHDRMFYVWACREKTCRRKQNSIRAIRGVKVVHNHEKEKKNKEAAEPTSGAPSPPPPTPASPPLQNTGDLLFGSGTPALGGANPFSTGAANPFSSAPAPAGGFVNPFSANPVPAPTPAAPTPKPEPTPTTPETLTKSFSSVLSLNLPTSTSTPTSEPLLFGPAEPWPTPLPQFPHFFLDAELETLEPEAPLPTQQIQVDELDTTSAGPEPKDVAADGNLDKVFQRFADRVAQNPDQVLRYERGGVPLLYSADDAVGKLLKGVEEGKGVSRRLPACGNCGKRERVFEFQIMPTAISVLEGDEAGFEGMEWGTVIVGSCLCVPKGLDANGVGWVEEWVGVQWEGQGR